jgi:hypothetical protein
MSRRLLMRHAKLWSRRKIVYLYNYTNTYIIHKNRFTVASELVVLLLAFDLLVRGMPA